MELSYPLLLDGATGTELQKRGFAGETSAEEWTLAHPEAILEIQRAYAAAGSRVLYAPTFGANSVKLAEHGVRGRTAEFNRRLAALTVEAAQGRALVAGDMAPTGHFLAPLGDMSFEALVEVYTEQAAALETAGVDLFVIETMMSLPEARAAVLAVRSVSAKPVWVSFTCDGRGRTLTGSDVAAALAVMQGMGVDAFGLNCSAGPEEMLAQLQRLRAYARIPLIAKPNAGLPRSEAGRLVYDCPPEEFVSRVPAMAAAGVAIFGGCCGTTPAHIAALREALAGIVPAPAAPAHRGELLCATEKEAVYLPADMRPGAPLPCDEELEEALSGAPESGDALVTIALKEEAELENFAECQYMIEKPLCLQCGDAALLERALRLYQGRALYRGALPRAALAPLQARYGLVI